MKREKKIRKVKFTYTPHQPIPSDLLHCGVATSYIISLSNKQRTRKNERKRKHYVYRRHTLCALNSQQKGIKSRKKRNYCILSRHWNDEKRIETSSNLFISSCVCAKWNRAQWSKRKARKERKQKQKANKIDVKWTTKFVIVDGKAEQYADGRYGCKHKHTHWNWNNQVRKYCLCVWIKNAKANDGVTLAPNCNQKWFLFYYFVFPSQ